MPKCLECGKSAPRLQWTHFKYNCTGRFKNGTEYMAAFPDATIVDENIAKKTAITQENLMKKYGPTEGNSRWESYKEKQAISNSYEYKKQKYGWTEQEFNEYNSSRAQTLEKMISRHGEVDGTLKWIGYCERQAYTNTKSYFIEKYGLELGTKTYLEINRKKAVSNPTILAEKMGISIDEAVIVILNRQKQYFTSNLEQEFISLLESKLGSLDHTSLKQPYGRWSHYLDTYLVYDIKHKDCIIEFNGDYWHANPQLYKETAIIRGKTAVDIWNRDKLKMQTVIDLGFRTYIVWEQEFRRNKEETINRIISWMLNE